MDGSELPTFRYHPDPVATGAIERSAAACAACDLARGWRYTVVAYGTAEIDDLCPWCIADGTAAGDLDVELVDTGVGVPDGVARSVLDELSDRTPGFTAWQDAHWMFHCDDAAAYLGPVGWPELQAHPDAVEALLHEHDEYGWSENDSRAFVEGLGVDHDATGYLFRCLHCGQELAYSDRS